MAGQQTGAGGGDGAVATLRVGAAGGGDEELYREVSALLERSAEAERALGESVAGLAAPLLSSLSPDSGAEHPTTSIGQQIGPYRVLEEIGRGGMGIVYRARDVRLDRVVALKFLPPYLSGDPEAKRRFIAEARAASATEHPNVATLFEISETADGQLYLVFACYEGETRKERIARGPLPPEEALGVARQIAAGLAAAHARGIVHRDIKPGNVLLTRDGWAKILDFGIAKIAGGDLTGPGVRLGTVAYMTPEQILDEAVDARADLWSLVVVLFEMLTGGRPFRGSRDETIIHAILHDLPAGLEPGNSAIPDALKPILARALAKDPELAEGHLALGLTYRAREQYERALEGYRRAVALQPNYPAAMINIGVVKWRLGRYDEALPWYRAALDDSPIDRALALSTIAGV